VKVRTRAFAALWVITVLVAGTIAFILVALNIAATMDAERQRLAEVLHIHGALWRTLVELKHDQGADHDTIRDYFAQQFMLVRAPDQQARLQQLNSAYERWRASGSGEANFEPVASLLAEFDTRERDIWNDTNRELVRRRELFFSILAAA
jgi:hypothetical protein